MKRLVEYPLAGGGSVLVEVDVDDVDDSALVPVASPGEAIARAQVTFEEALAGITPVAEAVFAQVRELTKEPAQVAVEFGLKLTGQTSFILASASVEANLVITMTWQNDRTG